MPLTTSKQSAEKLTTEEAKEGANVVISFIGWIIKLFKSKEPKSSVKSKSEK